MLQLLEKKFDASFVLLGVTKVKGDASSTIRRNVGVHFPELHHACWSGR